jgi:hypothetical protein
MKGGFQPPASVAANRAIRPIPTARVVVRIAYAINDALAHSLIVRLQR